MYKKKEEKNKMEKTKIGIIISIALLISLLIGTAYAQEQQTQLDNILDVPIGGIIMYNGDINDFDVPYGYLINDTRYHICNGFNGTIDLRHSYVAGYDEEEPSFDTIGNTLGNNSYNLTVDQLPSHRHEYIDWYPRFSTQAITNGLSVWCNAVVSRNTYTYYTGGNADIDNRPYTTVVNFIQRIS